MGLSFLSRQTRAAETAEAKRLDAAAEDATLATAGQAIEDAVNQAWADAAWYLGLTPDAASVVTLNRDYERAVLSPQMVQAVGALIAGGMPVKRAVDILIAGNVLKATAAEAEEIALEWEAGVLDAADRAADAVAAAPDQTDGADA